MRALGLLIILLLAGCASQGLEQRQGYIADLRHPAKGAEPRVKLIIIHYTAEDFPRSISALTGDNVSAHYLIASHPPLRGGQPLIWQLVPEQQLAWHAGSSYWRGATRLNDTSIGIELVNSGYRWVNSQQIWSPFCQPQIAALVPLLQDLVRRYGLRPQDIIGHSDVAPQRKQDPGPLFPWQQLARQGLGAWPDAARVSYYLHGQPPDAPVPVRQLLSRLAAYGYQVEAQMTDQQQRKVIAAFQMHFRPQDYRGLADAQTLAIVSALLEKYGSR
ncbi:N-acetylmuramoyl-L-alanine amidase [Erwinia sp. OLTSP20]|nr:N-acetylmuramoyl-L-alanine amidase [Erwinia sp. OAMSP11]PIJ74077.1 N-acetylmuramoyl-L-alanine amidase [Erwinia sp. OLSSP12]PIJ81183.1 N-acetylmuramoyl-L-alanine amidase [Erwinia sp. OLCASP19]PIJ86040.1 N-acetylmuramoyl-L-alanine amidase [Erwinia sp. OLMTSP26]PIJ87789.1 N-acetylmuramoyl-L-alanine amidase [Erwinia sp. OLMDSP33]PIJ90821.1 N-acetylmuramoyl-L-alanine amidase [Erwinia sp. OLFS4]PIJ92743.1 N-acetylmuramoyl-L-alanine amidase [Erwinia sp. OLTSP20]